MKSGDYGKHLEVAVTARLVRAYIECTACMCNFPTRHLQMLWNSKVNHPRWWGGHESHNSLSVETSSSDYGGGGCPSGSTHEHEHHLRETTVKCLCVNGHTSRQHDSCVGVAVWNSICVTTSWGKQQQSTVRLEHHDCVRASVKMDPPAWWDTLTRPPGTDFISRDTKVVGSVPGPCTSFTHWSVLEQIMNHK